MSAQHTPGPQLKVYRRCPRCRKSGEQYADVNGKRNHLQCWTCGHQWAGRVTLIERGGERP